MGIRSLIEQINVDAEIKAAETYRFVEEQKIKKALAPAQWEDLQERLEGECDKIKASSPMQLALEKENIYEITVTNLGNGKAITLRYDRDVPCIHVNARGKSGHLGFRVVFPGTSVEIVEGEIPRNIADITVNLVRRIL